MFCEKHFICKQCEPARIACNNCFNPAKTSNSGKDECMHCDTSKLIDLIEDVKKLKDGQPCKHSGCLNHISHPCEGCGRIGGVKNEKG